MTILAEYSIFLDRKGKLVTTGFLSNEHLYIGSSDFNASVSSLLDIL